MITDQAWANILVVTGQVFRGPDKAPIIPSFTAYLSSPRFYLSILILGEVNRDVFEKDLLS